MSEVKFYRCDKCGELVLEVSKGHCVPQCCGEEMRELKAGVTDAAVEKHVPAVERQGRHLFVRVGEVAHPMLEEHYIEWIAAAGAGRVTIAHLKPGDAPEARFGGFAEDEPVVAYAYCNLHGLWKSEL